MRTRIYNKCTNNEVEEYFARGGKTLIIASGTIEMHGDFPMDSEAVVAEAAALKIAERTDALVATSLPYFCAGTTVVGRGTFNISIENGVHYLKQIIHSFYRQGFRRMMIVSMHGPAYLTYNTVCMDFFHEMKDVIVHCDLLHVMQIAHENGWQYDPQGGSCYSETIGEIITKITYGAYKMLNQLEYIPVIPDYDAIVKEQRELNRLGYEKQEMKRELYRLAPSPGLFGSYYYTKEQHGFGEASTSVEEREQRGTEGEKLLTDMINYFEPEKFMKLLDDLNDQIHEEIIPRFPHLMNQ